MSRHPFAAAPGQPAPFSPLGDPLAAPSAVPVERRRSRSERRAWQRLPVRVAVRQQVKGNQAVLLAQSSDLGLGGMRLWRRSSEKEPELSAHTEVELAFELPGSSDLLTVRGEVIFDEAQGEGGVLRATGVRFCGLSEPEQTRLREFLTRPPAGDRDEP
jgi:hypothetical protein